MTLGTLISAALAHPPRARSALVLMGGGARTAYQAGVLRALARMLRLRRAGPTKGAASFPFQVLVGTSAGALNAAFLAGQACAGLDAFDRLADFWGELRSEAVYRLDVPAWTRVSRLATAVELWGRARARRAVLDSMPLIDALHRHISLAGIDDSLRQGALHALAVTASSYTTGVHWTFVHTARDGDFAPWKRPGRRALFQPITMEHLMASSAIPFLFPATPLWVDCRREFFGDGSMRQVAPLSPALHLGADRVLVLGVGQPERASLVGAVDGEPGFGAIAGHTLGSVFYDSLQADVEQTQRVTETVRGLPPELAAALPYRPVDVLALQPSQSLDALAAAHLSALPRGIRRVLAGLGAVSAGAPLASYLLFEPGFIQALIRLGEQDAYARKSDLLALFEDELQVARA